VVSLVGDLRLREQGLASTTQSWATMIKLHALSSAE
jgi:hypothetical protein